MSGAIEIGCRELRLDSPQELFQLILRKKWYSTSIQEGQAPGSRQEMFARLWAEHSGLPSASRYSYSPPSDIACLVVKSIARCWMMELSPTSQLRIRKLTIRDVSSPALPLLLESMPTFADSHVHCDAVLSQGGYRSWEEVMREHSHRTDMQLVLVVYSCNFPKFWHRVEDVLSFRYLFMTVGLHPHITSRPVSSAITQHLRRLMDNSRCIGFGEIGLDYNSHTEEEQRHQREYLRNFLPEVSRRQKPLVIHCRSHPTNPNAAREDLIPLLQKYLTKDHPIYIHSFCEENRESLEHWLTSFSTCYFGLGKNLPPPGIVLAIPINRFLLESDAPYQMSSPWELLDTAKQLAQLHNLSVNMLAGRSRVNTREFYNV